MITHTPLKPPPSPYDNRIQGTDLRHLSVSPSFNSGKNVRVLEYCFFKVLDCATKSGAQVVLVSATLPHEILEMTKKFMTDPIRILVKR